MDPEKKLAALDQAERRLWTQHERQRGAGDSNTALQPLREAALAKGQARRDLWAETYEQGRSLERKR